MVNVFEGEAVSHRRKAAASDARLELSIAQADAGELVGWEDAEMWIESWGKKNELSRPESNGVE